MSDATTTIAELKEAVRRFAAERQWEPYHNPKNLAMALACEVGELLEIYRWVECEPSRYVVDDPEQRKAVSDELADIACLLFNLSLSTGIDLSDAVRDKMIRNAQKYPAPTAKPGL
jgi:NTP pyrophosphatase (non-canonical NTP hydrolase)